MLLRRLAKVRPAVVLVLEHLAVFMIERTLAEKRGERAR
jgi:hypothetical protein